MQTVFVIIFSFDVYPFPMPNHDVNYFGGMESHLAAKIGWHHITLMTFRSNDLKQSCYSLRFVTITLNEWNICFFFRRCLSIYFHLWKTWIFNHSVLVILKRKSNIRMRWMKEKVVHLRICTHKLAMCWRTSGLSGGETYELELITWLTRMSLWYWPCLKFCVFLTERAPRELPLWKWYHFLSIVNLISLIANCNLQW